MEFTSKDLANAMGLKIGDRIEIKVYGNVYVTELTPQYTLSGGTDLCCLINKEYRILPPEKTKKKVGDLICKDTICRECPLCIVHCANMSNESLYDNLEYTFEGIDDKEMYDILKSRLDKEVEE